MRNALYFLFVSTFLPLHAHASVLISEIMYDLPGTDTGREWVEITNTSSSSLDFTMYKFYEAETNHALTLYRGNTMVSSGGYAVVVDDADLFLADNPSYSGAIFDSSWSSLSNEGESLEIRDAEGSVLDHIAYSKEQGALGDGMSLGRNGNSLVPQNPSPGTGGAGTAPLALPPPSSSNSSQTLSGGSGGSTSSSTIFFAIPKNNLEQSFAVSAGGNRILMEQIQHVFDAKVTGVPSSALPYVQYRWNFGNGEEVLKQTVEHRYLRRGEYVVVLSATSGGKTVTDRIVVAVTGPELTVKEVGSDGIEFKNTSSRDIDLSGWHVRAGVEMFRLPHDTWILAGRNLFLESRVSKLHTSAGDSVELLFPNGVVATESQKEVALPVMTPESLTKVVIEESKRVTVEPEEEKEDVKEKELEPIVRASETKPAAPVVNPSELGVAAALAAVPESDEESPLMMPILGLVALIGISSGAVILMRQSKGAQAELIIPEGKTSAREPALVRNKTNEADSYTIIE